MDERRFRNIIFIDTETSGFYKPTCGDYSKDPWIVEIAAILVVLYEDGEIVELDKMHCLIQSEGRYINPRAEEVHKISAIRADKEGSPESTAASVLADMLKKADTLCCHNTDFDYKFVFDLFQRQNKTEAALTLSMLNQLCTMKASTDYCKIPHTGGVGRGRFARQQYKWPKLTELYEKCFGRKMVNAHSALDDVTATVECFEYLNKNAIVDFELFDYFTEMIEVEDED